MSALPFAPLTTAGLSELRHEAAIGACALLSYSVEYREAGDEHEAAWTLRSAEARALLHRDLLAAAMARH